MVLDLVKVRRLAAMVKWLTFFLVALGVISRFLIHVLEWFSRICPW